MDMDQYKNAPDAVTIEEAAKILGIPADWVAAKIDAGLPAYLVENSRLVRLSSLIPCGEKPTCLQEYYLTTRIPRTDMKPHAMYCEVTSAEDSNIEEGYTDFEAIRILKKDLLELTLEVAAEDEGRLAFTPKLHFGPLEDIEIGFISADSSTTKDLLGPVNHAATVAPRERPPTPDVTGRRGVLQQLLFDTLTDYYSTGNVLEQGSAFRTFLKFMYDRYTSKLRPDYMSELKRVDRIDPKACLLWMEKGKAESRTFDYVSKEFSKIRKEFSPNI